MAACAIKSFGAMSLMTQFRCVCVWCGIPAMAWDAVSGMHNAMRVCKVPY